MLLILLCLFQVHVVCWMYHTNHFHLIFIDVLFLYLSTLTTLYQSCATVIFSSPLCYGILSASILNIASWSMSTNLQFECSISWIVVITVYFTSRIMVFNVTLLCHIMAFVSFHFKSCIMVFVNFRFDCWIMVIKSILLLESGYFSSLFYVTSGPL